MLRCVPSVSVQLDDQTGSAHRTFYLLDLLNNRESSVEFLQALTGFVNILLRGQCPKLVGRLLFAGTLIAL